MGGRKKIGAKKRDNLATHSLKGKKELLSKNYRFERWWGEPPQQGKEAHVEASLAGIRATFTEKVEGI